MKVKFSRCNSNSLANVPQVDGQLIYVKDTSEVYMDVGNNRNKLSDVIEVADITNVQNPIISKIYYDEATEKLYKYIDNEWKSLGGDFTPQVFFWDALSGQTAVDLWNDIYDAHLKNDVILTVRKSMGGGYDDIIGSCGIKKYSMKDTTSFNCFVYSNTSYNANSGIVGTHIMSYYKITIKVTLSNNVVTKVEAGVSAPSLPYIKVDYNYGTPYTPQYAGSPATKKYVDDSISTYTPTSTSTTFDNTGTGLQATNVQDAIEELLQKINDLETTVGQVGAILDEINGEII